MGSQVPIHNPLAVAGEFLLELYPLIPPCLHKAWLPKKLVLLYHPQSCDLAKLAGKGRLARRSGTNDGYALHTHRFSLGCGGHSVPRRVLAGCFVMALSLAQKALKSKRPVVLFHTWTVTRELLGQAIREKRSMDLDVCIDDQGHPYLGHPKEYHEKTHDPFFGSMPLWEAVEALTDSSIPVIVELQGVPNLVSHYRGSCHRLSPSWVQLARSFGGFFGVKRRRINGSFWS